MGYCIFWHHFFVMFSCSSSYKVFRLTRFLVSRSLTLTTAPSCAGGVIRRLSLYPKYILYPYIPIIRHIKVIILLPISGEACYNCKINNVKKTYVLLIFSAENGFKRFGFVFSLMRLTLSDNKLNARW